MIKAASLILSLRALTCLAPIVPQSPLRDTLVGALWVATAVLVALVILAIGWTYRSTQRGWSLGSSIVYFVVMEQPWDALIMDNRESIMVVPRCSASELTALTESGRMRRPRWSRLHFVACSTSEYVSLLSVLVLVNLL